MKQLYRADVFSAKGRRVGRVGDVLVRQESKTVVGYVVERPRLLMLWDLKDRFLAFDRAKIQPDGSVTILKGPGQWDAAAENRLGIDWEQTVIWLGMPVRTVSGRPLGVIRDAAFDESSGAIGAVGLTAGVTADLAVGVRDVQASLVRGYTDGAIVVEDSAAAIQTDGGAAAVAGRGAAVAKQVASGAAQTASAYGKAAAKAVGRSETGRKAVGFFKSLKDQVVDAMGDPDDE